jgi:hypothetical protein
MRKGKRAEKKIGASGLASPGKPGVPGETPQPRDPQRPGGAPSNAGGSEKEGKRESGGTRAVIEGQRRKPTSPPSADRESSTPEQPYVATQQPEPETDPESRQPRDRDAL